MSQKKQSIVALIVAVAKENRGIGWQGRLPWQLPGDLRHFRSVTMGKPVIMGRNTWQSLGRPLPGRLNIVLSLSGLCSPPAGVHVKGSLSEALALAAEQGAEEIMVIGGSAVYAEALPLAQRIYLTEVDAAPQADVFFPQLCPAQWRERESRHAERLPGDQYSYCFRVLERAD